MRSRWYCTMRLVAAVLLVSQAAVGLAQHVVIRGSVRDAETHAPIATTNIQLAGTRFATQSSDDGAFSLGAVPKGTYTLTARRLGYAARQLEVVVTDSVTLVDVTLTRAAIPLAAVVVTPGYYGVMQAGITASHSLSRAQIETAPQLGEDVYRAVARLPGVTSSDMSARFGVRGAPLEEVYSTLDGLELDEPFHLKDLDAALSIIDVSSIAGVDMITGGFPADYGNRLTGVFNMHSVEPVAGRTRQAAALSIMNVRYTIEGGDRDGRHGWYASVRRGYLDLALKLASYEDSLSPGYGDVFAKYFVNTSRLGRFGVHTLVSGDHLNYFDGPRNHLLSSYANRYVWGTWTSSVGRLRQSTVLSWGDLRWRRNGDIRQQGGLQTLSLDDKKDFHTVRLRQDWQANWSPSFLTKVGLAASDGSASYDYFSWQRHQTVQSGSVSETWDTISVAASPSGSTVGGYLSQRVRVAPSLTVEGGVRYDHASYAPGSARADPRLSVAWDATANTTVRAAWGRYSQFQQLHALHPGDRDTTFHSAERAEHRTLGVEQRMRGYVMARVELYERRLTDPATRFVNLANQLDVFSELAGDRTGLHPTSGLARGVETIVQRSGVGRNDWSATYALASIRDRFGAQDVSRGTDQRHTFTADWAFHPVSNRWRMSVAWTLRSGFPITPQTFTLDSTGTGQSKSYYVTTNYGALYSEHLPRYQRVDARFTRYWDTSRGQVALYADVFNLLGRANPRAYDYDLAFNPFRSLLAYDTYLPRFPSLGLSWTF